MHAAGRVLRWVGVALAVPIMLLLIGFGLVQTRPGKNWLAGAIARASSSPDFVVAIDGLHGLVPFRVRIDRIAIADEQGTYLTLRHIDFAIAPRDLLSGRLHLRFLDIAEVDKARPSVAPSLPLIDYLRVPRLPLALVLDRLTITRLVLGPAVLGEKIVAAVSGNGVVESGAARVSLALQRIDGRAGDVALRMALGGTNPRLSLHLVATEPTGVLLDHLLGRTDRLPLAVSVDGRGLVSDWRGRLAASAGVHARLHADITLGLDSATALGVSGTARVAPLLPPDLASVVGDRAAFSLHMRLGERVSINRAAISFAAGNATGSGSFDRGSGAVAATLRVEVPKLPLLSGILGTGLEGAGDLTITVSGTRDQPIAHAELSATGIDASGSGAQRIMARVSAAPAGSLDDPRTRIALAGRGHIDGLAVRGGGALVERLGKSIDWSFAAAAARDGRAIDLAGFSLQGGGLAFGGTGHLTTAGRELSGEVHFSGSATGVQTGIAGLDALIGGKAELSGVFRRDRAGVVAVDHFDLDAAAARLAAEGRFDPAANRVAAAASLDLPRLDTLGAAVGARLAGAATARVGVVGRLDHLRLTAEADGRGISAAGVAVDRLRLSALVADLSRRAAVVDGGFSAAGLDGTVALTAALSGNQELLVPTLRFTAGGATIDGKLRIGLVTALVQGSLDGRFADLRRWSRLAGAPLGGSLDAAVTLDAAGGGQRLGLSLIGTGLAAGAARSRVAIGHLTVSARLADLWRRPSGAGRLAATTARAGAVDFATVAASFSTPRPGRFAFEATAGGHPLTLALAGDAGVAPGTAELRLTRLAGSLGSDRFVLERPLRLTRHGRDIAIDDLALRLGPGRIVGAAAIRGEKLSLDLNAAGLPIAAGAQLIGYPGMRGALSLEARLHGTLAAPQGHAVLSVGGLVAPVGIRSAPRLGLTVAADWNGRIVALQGGVTGLYGDRVSFGGTVPLVLTRAPLGISVPRQGPLALRLQGGGEIGQLADLLPLGEDRLSGNFSANVTVGGTVAAPSANGRLQLTGARYANFTTGAVLTDLSADVVGEGDRFRLISLSARDGAEGMLRAQGSVALRGAAGPSAQFTATLAKFRLAARDEVRATASGTVSAAGPLSAPKIAAVLTIDRADITLPDSLPPSVVVIKVTEVNGRAGGGSAPPLAASAPALAMPLDITLRLPGQVFVRGHGLNSDWHGRLTITGTSAAPQISGSLVASRGSVDLLGKSFLVTRGRITFDGSAKPDPALDIVAEASAADITAQVIISGYASAPKITLASTPPVPQDEILSRVLFGQGVGQITASQGIQLAQAAATLAGGGPGALDKLRGKLGLDWLGFGQGPGAAASPILNPSVTTPSTSSATAVSAGKYVAPGVSVGVTQGVSPPTSKVTVEIDVGHHVTVDTEAGQNGGTGVGLNYKYDY